jgi:hypothetical protein
MKQGILIQRGTNGQKTQEKVFHFPVYKRDANQNNT